MREFAKQYSYYLYDQRYIYIYYLSDFAILSENTHSWFSKVYQKLDECDPLYRWIFWYTFQKDCLSRFYFHIDLGKIKQVCRNTIFLHSMTIIHNNISHLTYQVYNIYVYISIQKVLKLDEYKEKNVLRYDQVKYTYVYVDIYITCLRFVIFASITQSWFSKVYQKLDWYVYVYD